MWDQDAEDQRAENHDVAVDGQQYRHQPVAERGEERGEHHQFQPRASGSDPARRSRAAGVPTFRHQANNVMAAKLVDAADARNRADSQTVSLHTGWFVALNSAPVYEATKKAAKQPTAWTGRGPTAD